MPISFVFYRFSNTSDTVKLVHIIKSSFLYLQVVKWTYISIWAKLGDIPLLTASYYCLCRIMCRHFPSSLRWRRTMSSPLSEAGQSGTLDRANFSSSLLTISPWKWFRPKIWERKRKDSALPHVIQKATVVCTTNWKMGEEGSAKTKTGNVLMKENRRCVTGARI